ncbi:MAG: insulinase family protein, partial [Gemmatimonadaceae bacterium]|nr:insulinase family protein [Gemmatimonadaceae bacterium]
MIGLRGLLPDLDSSWAVFADRILAPTLDSAAVAVARDKLLAVARRRREEPDELVRYLADSAAFDGDAYGLPVEGTERSLAALASAALRRYHETQMVTSRMLLVVVGNVPRATLERLVAGTLARLPRGTYQWTVPA